MAWVVYRCTLHVRRWVSLFLFKCHFSNLPLLFQGATIPVRFQARYSEFDQEIAGADIATFTGVWKTQSIENNDAKTRTQSLLRRDYHQAVEQLLEDLSFELASLTHLICAADNTLMGSVNVHAEIQKLILEAKIGCSQEIRSVASHVGNTQAKEALHCARSLQPSDTLGKDCNCYTVWSWLKKIPLSGLALLNRCSLDLPGAVLIQSTRIKSLHWIVSHYHEQRNCVRIVVLCGLKAQDIIWAFTHQILGPVYTSLVYELLLQYIVSSIW